jgi:hypothetical protein
MDVSFPEILSSIGDRAFMRCGKLTAMRFPDGLSHIGDMAFSGCSRLREISIPVHTGSIGAGAFTGCEHMQYAGLDHMPSLIGREAFSQGVRLSVLLERSGVKTRVQIALLNAWGSGAAEESLARFLYDPCRESFESITEPAYKIPIAVYCIAADPWYRVYLKEHAAEAGRLLVDQNDISCLDLLLKNDILSVDDLDQVTEYAIVKRQLEAETMLMDYKNRNGEAADGIEERIDSQFSL